MRHRKKINSLGRKAAHRKETLSSLATALILNKRINTTVAKAKALRVYVEPLITRSKVDSTHSRRTVFSYLKNKHAVSELFREVAQKVADRPGGYTRILKTGFRKGDAAEMCFIELVDYNTAMLTTEEETQQKRTRRGRRRGKKTAEQEAKTPGQQPADQPVETTVKEASEPPAPEKDKEDPMTEDTAEHKTEAGDKSQGESKEVPAAEKEEETPAAEKEKETPAAEKKDESAKEGKKEKPSQEKQKGKTEEDSTEQGDPESK